MMANGKDFIDTTNPRSEAAWKAALDELIDLKLVEDDTDYGVMFQVTHKGFAMADELGE